MDEKSKSEAHIHKLPSRRDKHPSLGIRYAPDFVVLHRDETASASAGAETKRMLAQTSKLSHTFTKTNIGPTQVWFEFLAWQFIHLNRNRKYT